MSCQAKQTFFTHYCRRPDVCLFMIVIKSIWNVMQATACLGNTRRCLDAPCVKQSSAIRRSSSKTKQLSPNLLRNTVGRAMQYGRKASLTGERHRPSQARDLRSPENQRLD